MPKSTYAHKAHMWVCEHWQDILAGVPDHDIRYECIQAVEHGESRITVRDQAVAKLTNMVMNQEKWNIKEAAEQAMREIKPFEFITLAEIEQFIKEAIIQQFYLSVRSWRLEIYAP